MTERFRGHSISDPALYRSKEALGQCMERDPLRIMLKILTSFHLLDEEDFNKMDKEQKEVMVAAMKYAEDSPWPDPITLEEDVLIPWQ